MRPLSYWQQTATRPKGLSLDPPAHTILTTKICIIGAGIAGSSAAWHFAQRGVSGLVVDAREPALGASGRNAGMIIASGAAGYLHDVETFGRDRAQAIQQLAIDNRNGLIERAKAGGVPILQTGHLTLADSEEERAAIWETYQLLQTDGFPAEWIDEYRLGRRFYGVLKLPNEAVTQPAMLVASILESSRFDLVSHTRVETIEERPGGGVRVYCNTGLIIECEQALIATNAYTGQWRTEFADRITPGRGQIYVTEPTRMIEPTAFSSQFGFYYFRQIPEIDDPTRGRWLMGGGRNVDFDDENGHYREIPSDPIQAALEAYTHAHFPEFQTPKIEYRWAGIMGFTDTHTPLIGRLNDVPSAAYCVGFSGHGMGLGFKTAELTVDFMLDGTSPYPIAAPADE